MKKKIDFVTNSSSLSFILEKSKLKDLSDDCIVKLVELKLDPQGLDITETQTEIKINIGVGYMPGFTTRKEWVASIIGVLEQHSKVSR